MNEDAGTFEYPIAEGGSQRLAWIPSHVNKLLGSRWEAVMHEAPAAGFYGLLLWHRAIQQDPPGTLPDEDRQLARLAGLGANVERWRAHRGAGPDEGALYGWLPCLVRGPDGVLRGGRLYHRGLTALVVGALGRLDKRRDDERRRARLSRVKGKLRETGLSRRSAENALMAERVLDLLDKRAQRITSLNVLRVVEEISSGRVVHLTDFKGDSST